MQRVQCRYRWFSVFLLCCLLIPNFKSGTLQAADDNVALECDPQIYYGVQHCTADGGDTHTLIVDLNDPHVRVETVLPRNAQGVECNSVNHTGNDPNSSCSFPYPFETLSSMLQRHVAGGAVAVINTDYFGVIDASHGAEGLAIRNGVRLDGPSHNG
jgi:hypothetical protein